MKLLYFCGILLVLQISLQVCDGFFFWRNHNHNHTHHHNHTHKHNHTHPHHRRHHRHHHHHKEKNQPDMEVLAEKWNVTSAARSVDPVMENQNQTHLLPDTLTIEQRDMFLALSLLRDDRSQKALAIENPLKAEMSPTLRMFLRLFKLDRVASEFETGIMSQTSCGLCKAGVGFLQYLIRSRDDNHRVISIISKYCDKLNVQSTRVCEGIAKNVAGELVKALEKSDMNPAETCSFILGEPCDDVQSPHHEWDVEFLPFPKPAPEDIPIPDKHVPTFKVLHLSDTHYDPHYVEGSNAECDEPLCCRESSGNVTTPTAAAGKWGDYRKCDTPKRTIDNMMQHISSNHSDIDYIIWTGDLPPHDIWNQTKEEHLRILQETVQQMSEHFPGVPIFPALGNHESVPVNSFAPPHITQEDQSISWLYNELDDQWSQWLPESTSETVRRGAFYSVLVRPGFRIISLNMNYCYKINWWLLINSKDPANELEWLIYELHMAELAKEKVHIIGHIPPGSPDCAKVWSRNFYKIIARFESTITAQFYGHTHFDEFEVFYDPEDLTRPTNIAYIGPSVTPYSDLNPGYRIYYVDADHDKSTRLVIDHENWIMNLREANLNDNPIWFKSYSTRAAYGMPGLRPVDWNNFVTTLNSNEEMFNLYYLHYWKNSHRRPPCNKDCRKRLVCDAKTGRSHDRRVLCKDILAET